MIDEDRSRPGRRENQGKAAVKPSTRATEAEATETG